MTSHNNNSKDFVIGALLAAAAGGVAYQLLSSKKTRRKLINGASEKYEEIRDHLEDFVGTLEKNISRKVNKKTNQWTNKARGSIDYIKDQIEDFHLSEHKELGIGFLSGSLLGLLIGASASHYFQEEGSDEEGFLGTIGHHISNLKPILAEIQKFTDGREEADERPLNGSKLNDVLECAAAGLKAWNNIKKR